MKLGLSRVNWSVVFLSTPPVSNLWNQSFFWDPSQTPGIPLPSDCPRTTSPSSYCGLKDRKKKNQHVFDKRPWTFRGVYAQMGHFYLCTFSIESHLLVSQCGFRRDTGTGGGILFHPAQWISNTVLSQRTIHALKSWAAALNETPGEQNVHHTEPRMGNRSGSWAPVAFRMGRWVHNLKNYTSDCAFFLATLENLQTLKFMLPSLFLFFF